MKYIYFLLVIFVILYVAGVWSLKNYFLPQINQRNSQTYTIDENDDNSLPEIDNPEIVERKFTRDMVTPTIKLSDPTSMNKYIYPGSAILSQTKAHLELESSDSFDIVNNWYKSIIKENNITTVIVTNTNGIQKSTMEGSRANGSLKVTIKIVSQKTMIAVDVL